MAKNVSVQTVANEFIQDKNNKTFTNLINRLKPGLYSYAYNFVKDESLAKDVVEQTFIQIWKKIDLYNPFYNFSTWAYGIAKNEALIIINYKNKNLSHDTLSASNSSKLAYYSPIENPEYEILIPSGEKLLDFLYDASILHINDLQEPYKTVMYEKDVNQKQLQDIADELGWHLSTVKTRLRKARQDVSVILKEKYPLIVKSYLEHAV